MNTLEQRFWSKVNKNTDTGCWEWTAFKNKSGYGMFTVSSSLRTYAHRIAAKLDGRDPTGMSVCHSCDNPSCVNPAHLFLGTQQDNVDDMRAKGRANYSKPPSSQRKLTDDQVREIRVSKISSRALAKHYAVSQGAIQQIKKYNTYKDLI